MTKLNDLQLVKEFAKNNTNYLQDKGLKPDALHCYKDLEGNPLCYIAKLKEPETGKKQFRPISTDADGELQFKQPKWEQAYPTGEGKKPLYKLNEVIDGQSIYIVEGEKDADTLASLGITATTSMNGAGSADKTDWKPLQGKEVVIFPDNDVSGTNYAKEVGSLLNSLNVESVKVIDLSVLDLEPKADATDYLTSIKNAKPTITDDLLRMQILDLPVINFSIYQLPKGHLALPFDYSDGSFETRETGVYFVKQLDDEETDEKHLCNRLEVIAETRSHEGNNWGRLLKWFDNDGKQHIYSMPIATLQGDGLEFRKYLSGNGLFISPESASRKLLQIYVQLFPISKKAICTDRLGWFDDVFVLGHDNIGQSDDMVVFQSENVTTLNLSQQGSLQDWQDHVASLASGQNMITFAICTAFAGALLEPLEVLGGGFHYYGVTSTGKSTALNVASSVWGKPSDYVQTWNATGNALEGTASIHNHMPLILDEMGECDIKSLSRTIYMLSNGQGKGRMNRQASNKASRKWLLMFLSAGEVTAKQLLAESGLSIRGGQEVRIVQLDVKGQYGIFDQLLFADTGADQSIILKNGCNSYYGVAGIEWLKYLTLNKSVKIEQAKSEYQQFMDNLPKDINNVGVRVAQRFAVVATAGEMATIAGITGWEYGQATASCKKLLNDWLAIHGVGEIEHKFILRQIKNYIEKHGASRFQCLDADKDKSVPNRVGFIDRGSKDQYLLLDSGLDEICSPYNVKDAINAMYEVGWLNLNEPNRKKLKLGANKSQATGYKRLYAVYADEVASWGDNI